MISTLKKEILLADERNRGFAAVVRAGPYLFLAGSEGHRSTVTQKIDPDVTWQPEAQTRNSYDRIVNRLELCGYSADCVVWLEHFVSSQEWLHLRLALWRDYFGMIGTAGGGAQALMSGINMVTTTAVAVVAGTERSVVEGPPSTPLPGPWTQRADWVKRAYQPLFSLDNIRCSRAVQVGDLIFTVGVRGHVNPSTSEVAPVETPCAFGTQIRNSYEEYRSFLGKAGLTLRDLVRVDSHIRNVNRAGEYWMACGEIVGEPIPFVTSPIGMPVGGTGEMDMCAIAAAPGVVKEVVWHAERPTVAQAVRLGGLVFVSGCNGLHDAQSGALLDHACRDAQGQTRQAFCRLEAALGRFDVGLERILRLDVVLRDVHFEEEFLEILRDVLGQHWPAVTICGAEPVDRAEVELSAIAAA
jgi:enamine deaminase RidA (YjgF/YER057c/UK114 family)